MDRGKTAGQIWMPFGMIDRTGPGMRQVVGFGDRSKGRGTFWSKYGAPHVREPPELRFAVVRGVDRGIGVVDRGPCRARGRGGLSGLCSQISTIWKSIGVAATSLLRRDEKSSY